MIAKLLLYCCWLIFWAKYERCAPTFSATSNRAFKGRLFSPYGRKNHEWAQHKIDDTDRGRSLKISHNIPLLYYLKMCFCLNFLLSWQLVVGHGSQRFLNNDYPHSTYSRNDPTSTVHKYREPTWFCDQASYNWTTSFSHFSFNI